MTMSTSASPTNGIHEDTRSSQSDSKVNKIWKAGRSIEIPAGPAANILDFAFANLSEYDASKPLFIDAIDPTNAFSAEEARATVERLIAGLKKAGVKEGDCICIHAFNTIWYPLIWLAIIGAGGIVFGTNPSSPASELQRHLIDTSARYIITQPQAVDVVEQVASLCDISENSIFVLDQPGVKGPPSLQTFTTLLDHVETTTGVFNGHHGWTPSQTAAYCSTSGTTGLPKAARISHSYMVAQAHMIEQGLRSRSYQPTQLVCLPVFHAFAAQIALVLPLRLGIATYFLPRFDVDDFVKAVDTHHITDTTVVPPIITALLRLPRDDTSLKSLRYVLCAGASISAGVQSKLYGYIHPAAVIGQVWGATELGWVTMFGPGEKDESGSVGRLLPGVELNISNDNGTTISDGVVQGEALVRTPSLYTGYLNQPEATAASFDKQGFYRTGDTVYVKDGRVFLTGRTKDTMKVNGWQVSPTEIENVLLNHKDVADAAVIGVSGAGEDGLEVVRPRAYVVKTQEDTAGGLTEEAVHAYVASKLVSYKRLTGGIVFVNKIPRNPTGKILRRLLQNGQEDATT